MSLRKYCLREFSLLSVCWLFAMPAALPDAQAQTAPVARIDRDIVVKRIWDQAPHNAFTDLAFFDGRLFCVFREGTGHVPGESGSNGAIRVLSSNDGEAWESIALISQEGVDLRDPKISLTPDNRLMLLAGGSYYDGNTLLKRQEHVCFLQAKAETFDELVPIVLDEKIANAKNWLWRVTWHENIGYGVVYHAGGERWGLHLVSSEDGIHYKLVKTLPIDGKPNESTIAFDNDKMLIVVRNEDQQSHGHLLHSNPPYLDFVQHEIPLRLGGPDLLRLNDGRWLLATRKYQPKAHTVLGFLSTTGEFDERIALPSGGDNSYPGLLWHEGQIWMSYYSSHEEKTAIYLAKIRLEDLE
jgi:hypothetical protein